MSDIEQRLLAAADRWREREDVRDAVTAATGVRASTLGRRVSSRLLVAAAAAAVVLVAAGAVVITRLPASDRASDTVTSSPAPRPSGLAGLVVHDGDRVRGDGLLSRWTDTEWQLCPDYPRTAPEVIPRSHAPSTSATDMPPEACMQRLALVTNVRTELAPGTYVRVQGTIRSGVIAASSVGPVPRQTWRPDPVPCPAPAGGWASTNGTSNYPDWSPIQNRLDKHPDIYGTQFVSYATDQPKLPNSDGGKAWIPIYVVGTTGDVDAARAELAPLVKGNLCVYPVSASVRELNAARARAEQVFQWPVFVSSGVGVQTIDLQVTRVSQQAADELAPIQALLTVDAMLRPI